MEATSNRKGLPMSTVIIPDQVIQCWRVVFQGRIQPTDFATREAAEAHLRALRGSR
jgi:hypothetical protein